MEKADSLEFRKLLLEYIQGLELNQDIALLFSGGTDSLTILWTLLNIGIQPHCYTFGLPNSNCTDIQVSKKAAEYHQLSHTIVRPPQQSNIELAKDLAKVITIIRSTRKTHVEVMWGYWWLFKTIKEQFIFSGLQADTLYGSSRSMAIKYSKVSKTKFTNARIEMISDRNQEGLQQATNLAEYYKKLLFTPYTSQEIRNYFYRYTWTELNRPRQKMPAVLGFERLFIGTGLYRRNENMQCESGIREYLGKLRNDKIINPDEIKSPAKLYERIKNYYG